MRLRRLWAALSIVVVISLVPAPWDQVIPIRDMLRWRPPVPSPLLQRILGAIPALGSATAAAGQSAGPSPASRGPLLTAGPSGLGELAPAKYSAPKDGDPLAMSRPCGYGSGSSRTGGSFMPGPRSPRQIELRPDTPAALVHLARSPSAEAGLARRARLVLLAADGVPPRQIGPRVGVARNVVRDWLDRCRAQGLAGLQDRPRPGRARGLSPRGGAARGAAGL